MKERMKYLWTRIQAAAIVGEVLLAALTAWAWILSLEYSLRMIPAAFFTMSLVLYNWFLYRFVYLPYKESRTVYEQFVKGYVLDDLFKMRYPFSAESAQAVQKFNELLDKENLINASKKQAEYLALQNQINPHFLYNTLEGIRSEALLAGLDGVAEMTEALATFFRYTISQVEYLVTLEDELANIENYYYIQQFRFGDKLALSIVYDHDEDVSELDILNCRLPKLTLQPIVENSIYHGIERKIGRGHLVIRIGVSDTRLRIRVSDDGLGMSEEKLYQLNEKPIKASGKTDIVGVGFDKSDTIMNLINDGFLLCTMAQNPDVMGAEGVKAAVAALEGQSLGGAVTDTGVSVIAKQ